MNLAKKEIGSDHQIEVETQFCNSTVDVCSEGVFQVLSSIVGPILGILISL